MASKIGIVLALDGEKEFTNGMKAAQQSAKLLDQELKNLDSQYEGNANSIEALTAKHEKLTQKQQAYTRELESAKGGQQNAVKNYREAGERLEQLQKEYEQAKNAMKAMADAGDTTSKSYKDQAKAVNDYEKAISKQQSELAKASTNITRWDTAVAKAQGDVNKANSALQKNDKYLDEASKSADGCAKSIDKMGKEASEAASETNKLSVSLGDMVKAKAVDLAGDAVQALGRKVVEAGKYAVEVGSSFEAAMSKVEALSGAQGGSLEALSQKAQELGRNTQFSATEAANALGNMALAGWNTQQMLDGIDGVLQLAASGEMDLATAADAVAGYLAAFNMQASDSTKLVDIMATAQAKSKTTADQLAAAYSTCATNLTQAGQSVYTTTALIEGLASVNDTGSSAGTHLSAVMAQITQKMQDGRIAIGDTMITVMDANGNFRDMIDIIADVEAAVDGMGDAERSAALSATFNRTSMSAMNELLAVGSENLRGYSDQLKASAGASKEMMDTMTDNFEGAKKTLGSAAEGLGVAVYDKIKGPLTGLTEFAADVLNGITDAIAPATANMSEIGVFLEETMSHLSAADQQVAASTETINAAVGQVGELEHYSNIIAELNEKESLNEFEKYQLKAAYDAVVQVVPELAGLYDDETGKIKANTDAITDSIKKKQEEIITNAKMVASQQALQAVFEAQTAATQADAAVAAVKDRRDALVDEQETIKALGQEYAELSDKAYKNEADYNAGMARMSEIEAELATHGVNAYEAIHGTGDAMGELESDISALDSQMEAAVATQEEANAKVTEAQQAYESTNASLDEAAKKTLEYVDAVDAKNASGDASREAAEKEAEAADKVAQAEEKKASAQEKAAKSAQESGNAVMLSAEAHAKLAEKTEGSLPPLDELGSAVDDLRPRFGNASEGAKSFGENIEEAAEKAEQTRENLKTVGEWASDSFGGLIKAAGEKAKAAVEEAAAQIPQKVAEYSRELATIAKDSAQAVTDAWEQMKETASQTITFSISSEFDGGDDLTTEKMNENLQSQLDGYKQYYENLQRMRELVAEGIITPEFFSNLEQQGTAAANEIQHMVWTIDNQGEYGVEQVKGISDKWTEAMNWQDVIASAIAGDQAALEQGLQALGSSKADFSALKETIGYGMAGVDEETRAKIDELVQTAEEMGVKIPDGLTEGIEKGEVSATALVDKLESAISGSLTGLQEVARTVGVELPPEMAQGIEDGTGDVVAAYNYLIGQMAGADLSGVASAASEAGAEVPKGFAEGVEEGSGDAEGAATTMAETANNAAKAAATGFNTAGNAAVAGFRVGISTQQGLATSTATAMAQAAANAARNAATEFNSAGANAGSNFASGVNGQAGAAYSAGANLASSGRSGASGDDWTDIGTNLAKGIEAGIRSQIESIASAARATVSTAKRAAKAEAEIQSPSKAWRREIGQMLGKGEALGISDSTEEVASAAEAQMNQTLLRIKKWLKANKTALAKSGQAYSDSITAAWLHGGQQLALNNFGIAPTKTTGSGDKAKTEKKTATEYYGEIYSAASKYLNNVKTLYNVSAADEVTYWQDVRKRLKQGTQAWYDASKAIKDAQKKVKDEQKQAAEDAAQKAADANTRIYTRAEQHVIDMQNLNKMSVKDELAYWNTIIGQLKKGSDEYERVEQRIKEAKAKFGTLEAADTLLDNYQVYYEMSAKAEMQYWAEVRKHYKTGTADRIKADKLYLEARKNYNEQLLDAENEKNEAIQSANEKLNEKLLDIAGIKDDKIITKEQARAAAVKKINDKLADDIKKRNERLTDDIANAIENRTNQIASAFNLFAEFDSTSATGEQLLFNLKSQAEGYKDWAEQLDKLEKRGVLSKDLMQELRESGPQNSAAIHALNMLSDSDLKEYNKAYLDKMEVSAKEAAKDTADAVEELRVSASKDIEELRKTASDDINQVDEDIKKAVAENAKTVANAESAYKTAVANASKEISDDLLGLAKNIENIATDMTSALVAAFESKEGQKAGAAKSVGSSVSAKTVNATSAGSVVQAATSGTVATAPTKAKTLKETLLDIINSGKSRSKNITAKEMNTHSMLWMYLVSKYGRQVTEAMIKKLAKALGISTSKSTTDIEKSRIYTALTKQGLASGTRRLRDPFAWMDEQGIGSEMIIRKSDGARLNTNVQAGDAIVPAANTDNLWKWSQLNPDTVMPKTMSEASMNSYALTRQAQLEQARAETAMAGMMSGMLEIMQTYMPYMAQRQRVTIGADAIDALGRAVTPSVSNTMAIRTQRRRA